MLLAAVGRLRQLVLHPLRHRRRGAADRDRRHLQEIQEDPVRAAPVGRHHPAARGADVRARRAAARGRAGDSTTKLRYLSPRQGRRLPRLSARPARTAHQAQHCATLTSNRSGEHLHRPRRRRSAAGQVTPQRLIISFLLSTEWLMSRQLCRSSSWSSRPAFGVVPFALGGLIPLVIGMLSLICRRVIAHVQLHSGESPRGLRITRGLTNLTSQSVPINRIQGVKTSQPLLWRPLGWYRVDIDILGYAQRRQREQRVQRPPACCFRSPTVDEVELALGRVLPGFDLDGDRAPRRPDARRWLRLVRLLDPPLRLGRPHPDHRAGLDHPRSRHRPARQDSVRPHRAGPLATAAAAGRRPCPHPARACERGRPPAGRSTLPATWH